MGKGGVLERWVCVACGCLATSVVACSSEDEGPGNTGSGGSGGTAAAGGTGGTGGTGASGGVGGGAAGGTGGSAASGGSGASGAAGGSGGTGGTGGASQGQPFVPEGVTHEYVGQGGSSGLEIIAFTLVQQYGTLSSPAFFVAVRNTGTDPICYVDVPAAFFNASGAELASTPGTGALGAPAYDSFGSPSPCLGTGDIGMGMVTSGLSSLDVSQVTRIEHGFIGNIDPDATKITTVTIQGVTIETAVGTSVRATGTVRNSGTGSISDPDVAVYAVDPVGRPYAEMTDIELTTIAAGGSWTFQTLPYDGEVNEVVSYVAFDMP